MPFVQSQIGPLFRAREFDVLREIQRAELGWFTSVSMGLLFDSAARIGDFDAMQFMLDIGYNINEVNYTGTPLSRAASDGRIEVIHWLLDHGANLNESTLSTNPLFSAISGKHAAAVRLFLDLGVDPERRYPCGRNALDFARTWNDPAIIAELGGDSNWKRPAWVNCSIPDFTGHRPSVSMVQAVEQELGFCMHESFKFFLLNEFPEALFFEDAKDNDEWIWLGPDHKLFHTARSLIAYNCIDPEKRKKKRKYKNHFVIGTDGTGNDWTMSTSVKDGGVWSHDHESKEVSLEFCSLREFALALQGLGGDAL
ncbi:MAG: ankyrin repeat domain-containing protein [Inhella sp.]